MLTHCIDCAQKGQTCCEQVDIYITGGDIERIARLHPCRTFYRWAELTAEYEDGGGDPAWNALICNARRQRRVLCCKSDGGCFFLTATGCSLPEDVRPLLCRIYPYDFREHGLCGISACCPVAAEQNGQEILEASQMHRANALKWVAQLYREIRADCGEFKM